MCGTETAPGARACRAKSDVEKAVVFILMTGTLCAVLSAAVRRLTAACSSLSCARLSNLFFSDSNVKEELKPVLQSRMRELKMSRLQSYLQLACLYYLPLNLGSLYNELPQRSFPILPAPAGEIGILVHQAICAVAFVRPRWLTSKYLEVLFVTILVSSIVQVTPALCCTEPTIEYITFNNWIFVMGLSLVMGPGNCKELLLLLLGEAAFLGCVGYTRWTLFRRQDAMRMVHLFAQFGGLSMILGAIFDSGSRKLLLQGLQLAEAREMQKAATALLRSCYDVVVELDSLGRIEGASQDFGSLLLRADHNRSMQGVELQSLFVDEEDKRDFQDKLAAPRPQTVGLAENMHVGMKDTCGNTLRMEMMWFACEKADGCSHFIVGLREFSDLTQPPPPSQWQPSWQELQQRTGDVDVEGSSSSSSDDMRSPSLSQVNEHGNINVMADASASVAMAIIDVSVDQTLIRRVTHGFRKQVGHVPRNAPLSRIVAKPREMEAWMQRAVNAAEGGDPMPADFRASLLMPHGKLRAWCRLVPEADDSDSDTPVDHENLMVLFHSISRSRREASSARSSHSSSSGLSGTPAMPFATSLPVSL